MDVTKGFLFFLLLVVPSSAILTDILKTCRNVSCEVDSEYSEYPTLNPRENYKWIAAGLPLIFWDAVADGHLFTHSNISVTCRQQLEKVSSAMRNDSEWGYRFLDSSGKSPPGLFRSTPTALGEFDECLAIDAEGIKGQYCMIDMHHLRKKTTAGQMDFQRIKVVPDYPFFSALCLPSTCSAVEVQSSLRQLLKHHLIKVAGHISCDTRESIGWEFQLEKMTVKQWIAVALITTVLTMTAMGTLLDAMRRQNPSVDSRPSSDLLTSMSIGKVCEKLFYAKPYTFEVLTFDFLKLVLMTLGVVVHIILCTESPISYATFSNLDYLDGLWRTFVAQFSVNDTGVSNFAQLTGMGTFMVLYPMVKKKKKVPYFSAFVDRCTRFLPLILILTACEMLWPLSGSGPFFSRTAGLVHQRCEDNWYLNLFFLNNFFIEGVDACATHSFWLCVDVQMFIAGLMAIHLFGRSDKLGLAFCAAMITIGTIWMSVMGYVTKSAISFYYVNPDPVKINEYYTDIYEKPLTYFPGYFAGFLIAYARCKGHLKYTCDSKWKSVATAFLTFVAFNISSMNYSLYNVFHILDDDNAWILIPTGRLLNVLGFGAIYLFWTSLEGHYNRYYESEDMKEDPEKLKFHMFKAMVRLCLPLYIFNYLYIRYEFFTRRFLHPNGSLWMVKRSLSSLLLVFIFTLVMHLLLLGPLDALRAHLMEGSRRKDRESDIAAQSGSRRVRQQQEVILMKTAAGEEGMYHISGETRRQSVRRSV